MNPSPKSNNIQTSVNNHSDLMTIKALVETHPDYKGLLRQSDRNDIDALLTSLTKAA